MFERKEPLISIIIPSWFTKNQDGKYGEHETFWLASECLGYLISRTDRKKYELIIIDNGSTLKQHDIEESFNSRKYAGIKTNARYGVDKYWEAPDILIRNKENLGFGPACNLGFNVARGKYIVCLNNDIIVWDGWEEALINIIENEELTPRAGVAMPALMKETNDSVEALKINSIDLTQNFNAIGEKAEFGSLWMATKEILEKIKKLNRGVVFDERFLLGMGEDRYLWHQIRKLGYETYRTHKTRVFHQGNMTIGKVKDRKEYTSVNRELLQKLKEE
jgi:GT2 family glycosyltransferase